MVGRKIGDFSIRVDKGLFSCGFSRRNYDWSENDSGSCAAIGSRIGGQTEWKGSNMKWAEIFRLLASK